MRRTILIIPLCLVAIAIAAATAASAQTSVTCSQAYLNNAGCQYEPPVCRSDANLGCRSNCLDRFLAQCNITNPEETARRVQFCCRACNQQFCR